ncbi:MAG: metallophosphoesterase [Magnetovibrio sp.]|nr:metallophosphoesterase [Magnetovibrio sp.]
MSEILASIRSIEELIEHVPDLEDRLSELYKYLQTSEQLMLDFITDVTNGNEPRSVDPDVEGELEFGLFLHWLNNPIEAFEAEIDAIPLQTNALMMLRHFAPQSQISTDIFNAFQVSAYELGFAAADGTLWTFGKYAQLDVRWLGTVLNYGINLAFPDTVYTPYPPANLAYNKPIGTDKDSISIAIIGDWGTGAYGDEFGGKGPAIAVMNAVRGLSPDYAVHLGDVYYSGTAENRHPRHEEQENFINDWKTGIEEPQTNFTLNSNHEMYGAAKGLIEVALAGNSPFSHQNSAPYFALDYGNWIIIGLDSAYFDPSNLYMQGAVGGPEQQDFVDSLGLVSGANKDKKVMVMTHHNPMSYDGQDITQNQKAGINLLDGIKALLGKQPDLWYWGHLHLGVAYNDASALGQLGIKSRCIGHGGIPFGNASGMIADNVDYFAHTPLQPTGTIQVQNGFAVLTIQKDGTISEIFYEVTDTGTCVQMWPEPA